MFRRYKYRLYPNELQKESLRRHFGASRFIYNLALETKNYAYNSKKINVSRFELCKQFTDLRKDCPWMKELHSASIRAAITNLDFAFNNFFKGSSNYPVFKKKKSAQSYQIPLGLKLHFENSTIKVPKISNPIKAIFHRRFNGKIKTCNISESSTGKFFICVLVESESICFKEKEIKPELSVGIDLGIKTFAVLSNGKQYENPKHLRSSLNRLKALSRRIFNKKRGSKNRKKAVKKLAILHEKIKNQRLDFLHKTSTEITNSNETIVVENLNIAGLVKNRSMAMSISDAGWAYFINLLKYKTESLGGHFFKIGTFEPTSKMHYDCGYIKKDLTLSDRTWLCPQCGNQVDRDLNASINILNIGLSKYSGRVSSGEPAELPVIIGAMKQERVNYLKIS